MQRDTEGILLLECLLRILCGFLVAIGLTAHVLACPSCYKADRDERCPRLYRYEYRRSVPQARCIGYWFSLVPKTWLATEKGLGASGSSE